MRTLVILLVSVLVAGCFGGEDVPDVRTVTASGGKVSPGYAYDGTGLVASGASMDGTLANGANTGIVNVSFEYMGSQYVITFDQFAQAEGKDFQDGGIAFELPEHGDTGAGDALIPRIHAHIAAWGTARVMKDGALATPEPWAAHLMVSRDTVRGTDGKIAKADGATPYDPATPTDARRVENDPQAIFFVKHPQGETFARPPAPVALQLTCTGPACVQSGEIPLEDGASRIELNVTFAPAGGAPFALGRGTVGIVDANGVEVMAPFQATMTPQGTVVQPVSVDAAGLVGPLTVSLQGEGAFTVSVDGAISYADHPFLLVTWDELTLA